MNHDSTRDRQSDSTASFLFFVLQMADIVSTLLFLQFGVHEANPLIIHMMHLTSPLIGLLCIKFLGIGLVLTYIRQCGGKKLWAINMFYAALIVWNVVAILVSAR